MILLESLNILSYTDHNEISWSLSTSGQEIFISGIGLNYNIELSASIDNINYEIIYIQKPLTVSGTYNDYLVSGLTYKPWYYNFDVIDTISGITTNLVSGLESQIIFYSGLTAPIIYSSGIAQLDNYNLDDLDFNKNTILWKFKSLPNSDYLIDIYRSESPGNLNSLDGYDLLVSGLSIDTYSFDDYSVVGLKDRFRKWYYKLKLHNDNTYCILPDKPICSDSIPKDYIVKEILRQKTILLERHMGRTFYLLKRKNWGTHCPICWDRVLMRTTNGDCTTCYGTGWEGGYYPPIPLLGDINSAPKYNQIQMFGEWKPSDVMFITLHYPVIVPHDILVDDKNNRWLVNQVRTIEKFGIIIEQNIQLSLLSYDDKIYTIAIPKIFGKQFSSNLLYQPYISVSIDIINIIVSQNDIIPNTIYFNITNESNYNSIIFSIRKNANWIRLINTQGFLNPGMVSDDIPIIITTTNLPIGIYSDIITINAPGILSSPKYITINYEVQ